MPHAGRYTSAGRRPDGWQEPVSQAPSSAGRGGSSPSFSTSGLRPAEAARVATTVRRRLCLFTLSPPHGQARAWSPKRSAVPSHSGQKPSVLATGSRSRMRRRTRKGFQVQSQGLGRAGGQPGASTGLLQKLQVGSLCFAGGRNGQLGQLGFVQTGRKVLLSGRANRRSSDAIGSQHGSVEPLHRSSGGRPVSRVAGV